MLLLDTLKMFRPAWDGTQGGTVGMGLTLVLILADALSMNCDFIVDLRVFIAIKYGITMGNIVNNMGLKRLVEPVMDNKILTQRIGISRGDWTENLPCITSPRRRSWSFCSTI